MAERKRDLDQNDINWNNHKPLIDEICEMLDKDKMDIQKGMSFLHMYMQWHSDFNLVISQQTMNIYYQLIGGGAIQIAMDDIDKLFHKINVKNKDGKLIARFWPEELNKQHKKIER